MSPGLGAAARGDIILIRSASRLGFQIFIVHHLATSPSDSFPRVHGFDLHSTFDFQTPSDFLNWFKQVPNPTYAVEGLREEILEPMLAFTDTLPIKLSELRIDADDWVVLRPADGAVRKHLLSHCPFPCTQGTIENCHHILNKAPMDASYIIKRNWPDILEDYPYYLDSIIDGWTGGAACPGCMGYDLVKEEFELGIEIVRVAASGEDRTEVRKKARVCADKWKRALEQCGYLTPDAHGKGSLLWFPSVDYEFFEAAKERVLEDKICAICRFVPYEKGDVISGLPCKHFFHRDCLRPWLEGNDDCPVCRKIIFNGLLADEGEWPILPPVTKAEG